VSHHETARATAAPDRTLLSGLLVTCRPRQWAKNALVVAAPAAAGRLTDGDVLLRTLLAFVVFTIAASGTYLVNDVRDRAQDAAHPTKRHRPIAAGALPVALAATLGMAALIGAPLLALALGRAQLAAVVGVYVLLQLGYSGGLKDVPLVDLTIVASGFVLRAVAGGVAAGVPISKWFLIVTSFAALYVVASKRHAELRDAPIDPATTRRSLERYSPELLREIRFTASAVTLAAYVLWAFENAERGGAIWFELSILPFVLSLYRYGMAVDAGLGQAPEEILLRDRVMLVFALTWAAAFAVGVNA